MGPGSVQPAWKFDIREGKEDQLRLLEERSPELYKRLMVQGARPMIKLMDNGRWDLDLASNEGRVFDIETGNRWEWHGGRRVRVVHTAGKTGNTLTICITRHMQFTLLGKVVGATHLQFFFVNCCCCLLLPSWFVHEFLRSWKGRCNIHHHTRSQWAHDWPQQHKRRGGHAVKAVLRNTEATQTIFFVRIRSCNIENNIWIKDRERIFQCFLRGSEIAFIRCTVGQWHI